ncbi:MAG: hypothetical protein KJ666_03805, partial [Bacteroidetes bacterium]|nr:hypothetical protein [Bacteroidota bacterium]
MKECVRIIILFHLLVISLFAQTPKLIGPPGGTVHQNQLAIHPGNPNIVYSSTWSGALFRTTDGGNIVKHIETGFKDFWVCEIALPYNEQDFIYIYVGDKTIMSTNAGEKWDIIYTSNYISQLVFNPWNSDIVYMTRDDISLWRSNNKGKNWYEVKTFNQKLTRIGIASTDTSIIYAAADYAFYRSTNSGKDW